MAVVKRSISYQDIDGNPVTKDWWFSLQQSDTLDMEVVYRADVQEYLHSIVQDHKTKDIISIWRELLFNAVGQRKGQILVKSPEILEEFRYGGAFEQILSEIVENPDAGSSFFNSMMPEDVQADIAAEKTKVYTTDELLAMTDEAFARVAGKDVAEMSKEHMRIAFRRKENARKPEQAA